MYTVHKVPECLSLCRNWVPQPPPTKASVSPPWTQRGEHHSLAGKNLFERDFQLHESSLRLCFQLHATFFSAPCDFVISAPCDCVFSSMRLCFQLHLTFFSAPYEFIFSALCDFVFSSMQLFFTQCTFFSAPCDFVFSAPCDLVFSSMQLCFELHATLFFQLHATFFSSPCNSVFSSMQLCFQVNLVGTLRVTKACLPLLKSCAGRVLMVSSVAGVHAYPGLSVYCATKHAIEGLAQVGLQPTVSVTLASLAYCIKIAFYLCAE